MSRDERLDSGTGLGPVQGVEQGERALVGTDPAAAGPERKQEPEPESEHERLRRLSAEISREFAPRLKRTTLLLFDLDPRRLQAQWHVTPDDFAHAQRSFPGEPAGLRQVLRLCRLDADGRTEVVDRVVTLASASTLQGQQRFTPEQLGVHYLCELGLETDDGGWLMLVRSNQVWLAGEGLGPTVSESTDPQPRLEAQARAQPRLPGSDISAAGPEPEALPVEAALAAEGGPLDPVFPTPWPADDPRHPALSSATGSAAAGGLGHTEGTARDAYAAYELPPMPPPLLPSSPEQAVSDALSESGGSIPRYDPRAALSSASLRRSEQPDLEVEAELVVKGRAAPGLLVELFGFTLRAGEDGRFSIRHPISDPFVLSLALGGRKTAKPADPEQE